MYSSQSDTFFSDTSAVSSWRCVHRSVHVYTGLPLAVWQQQPLTARASVSVLCFSAPAPTTS